MPKQISSHEQKLEQIEDNSAQNQIQPARNVDIKAKTKKSASIESAVCKVQKGGGQVSRSTIQFVASMNYIVFFFGFLACRHEPFARYHHNQALWLWIIAAVLYLSFAFIPGINVIALPFVIMLHLMGVIAGVSTALRGRAFCIPVLGKVRIIDWEKI